MDIQHYDNVGPGMPDPADKQRLFLDAFRESGTRRKAAAASHVGRSTVDKWLSEDTNGFRAAFSEAQEDFADEVEAQMWALLKEMKVGHNPTLMIFALKALRPMKYRELTHIPNENSRELLRNLEKLLAKTPETGATGNALELTPMQQVEQLLKEGQRNAP